MDCGGCSCVVDVDVCTVVMCGLWWMLMCGLC